MPFIHKEQIFPGFYEKLAYRPGEESMEPEYLVELDPKELQKLIDLLEAEKAEKIKQKIEREIEKLKKEKAGERSQAYTDLFRKLIGSYE